MARSILLMLSHFPQDTAGGAVRSLRTMCEWLASRPDEFTVAAVGTTASDHAAGLDARAVLRAQGCEVREEAPGTNGACPVLRFSKRGVEYALLDTGARSERSAAHEAQYEALLEAALRERHPDVVLTMGAFPAERARQKRCRERGAVVVLGVRQHGYYDPRAFEHVDDALMPSEFLVRCYHERTGFRGTAIPSPIELEDVVALQPEPRFATFVNPSREKGLMFFATLAEELCTRRAGMPLLVIEARGLGGALISAGRAGGFDLRRHESIMVSAGVAQPKAFFSATRILLAPSVWEEPLGRVAIEALLNGVPPVVSDRGGLPEAVGDGGFVLPLPPELTVETAVPVPRESVREWADVVERLMLDDASWNEASARARERAKAHAPEALLPRYVEYFRNVGRTQRTRRGDEDAEGLKG